MSDKAWGKVLDAALVVGEAAEVQTETYGFSRSFYQKGVEVPRGDGTGPLGQGPMTGRGAGLCAGYSTPGYANSWGGRGMPWGQGWQRGIGRGWRLASYQGFPTFAGYAFAPPTEKAQLLALQSEAEHLKTSLAEVESLIQDLEQGDENQQR